jgi:uncharacterized protein YlxP (DUF503 family)
MIVKLLTVDLLLPGSLSLKDKRFVLSGLKAKLRRRFNVSVSEVEFQDKWQRSRLAVAMVGSSRRSVDAECDRVLRFIESDHRVLVTESSQELC